MKNAIGLAITMVLAIIAASLGTSILMSQPPSSSASFNLETSAFRAGAEIPAKFTCQGADLSPALKWTEPPAGTKYFVLILDDPDAPGGTFTHWIVFGIGQNGRELSEGINPNSKFIQPYQSKGGGEQFTNDFGKQGYNGPCPPPGKAHRYFFHLYAIDSELHFRGTGLVQDRKHLEAAMQGHILGTAELMGTYQRR